MNNKVFSIILLCLWISGIYFLLSITDAFQLGYDILKLIFKIIGIPVIIFTYQSFFPFVPKKGNINDYKLLKTLPLMIIIGAMLGSLVDHIRLGMTIAFVVYLIFGLYKIGIKLFYK